MTDQPLAEAANEHAATYGDVGGQFAPMVATIARTAYMSGAEHALRIVSEPGGVDRLRREIVEYGRLLGAHRRTHDSAPRRIE